MVVNMKTLERTDLFPENYILSIDNEFVKAVNISAYRQISNLGQNPFPVFMKYYKALSFIEDYLNKPILDSTKIRLKRAMSYYVAQVANGGLISPEELYPLTYSTDDAVEHSYDRSRVSDIYEQLEKYYDIMYSQDNMLVSKKFTTVPLMSFNYPEIIHNLATQNERVIQDIKGAIKTFEEKGCNDDTIDYLNIWLIRDYPIVGFLGHDGIPFMEEPWIKRTQIILAEYAKDKRVKEATRVQKTSDEEAIAKKEFENVRNSYMSSMKIT